MNNASCISTALTRASSSLGFLGTFSAQAMTSQFYHHFQRLI